MELEDNKILAEHQRIKEEKMNIEIVDRLNQIEIQEQVTLLFVYLFSCLLRVLFILLFFFVVFVSTRSD